MAQLIDVPGVGQVEFPDGMSDADIVGAIKKGGASWGMTKQESPTARAPVDFREPWGAPKFIGQTLANVPKSAAHLAGGLWDAVTSPLQTAGTLADAAAGGLRNLVPEGLRSLVDSADWNPQATQRATKTADAIGGVYKDRYGGAQNIMQTVRDDPVGAAADLSMLLGGGAGALRMGSRVAPAVAPVADALSTAATATNPFTWAGKGAQAVAKPVGSMVSNLIGELGTHTGGRPLQEAAKAGAAGGQAADLLLTNMRGNVPMADVVEASRANLLQMKIDKNAQYSADMGRLKTDRTVLGFNGVDAAVSKAAEAVSFKGVVKNESAAGALGKVAEEIKAWKALDPAEYHTPVGLDALKQKIGAIRESIPFEDKTSRMVVGDVYNAVKNEIKTQAPTYAKTMRDYETAQGTIDELSRALSLGDKASIDTSLRKLQSVMRNNANTNYGNRVSMVENLGASGGTDLMPALAGQALTSWAPRGLGKLQAGGTALLGVSNPALLGLLPFQSPRLMGEAAYYGGKTGGLLGQYADPVSFLGLSQAGLLGSDR